MTVALRSLHSSRMVILLVAVVLLTTAMFISFSTQFVKFKITVVGTNAGHRDATGASLRATQMNDTRYYGLNEHPGCAFLRSNSPRHSGGSEVSNKCYSTAGTWAHDRLPSCSFNKLAAACSGSLKPCH